MKHIEQPSLLDLIATAHARLKPTTTGTVWVDMKKTGVDAIVSAPQKGWTGPACCGLVMLSKRAEDRIHDDKAQPSSNSFCCSRSGAYFPSNKSFLTNTSSSPATTIISSLSDSQHL